MDILQGGTGPLWAQAGSAYGVAPPEWWALLGKVHSGQCKSRSTAYENTHMAKDSALPSHTGKATTVPSPPPKHSGQRTTLGLKENNFFRYNHWKNLKNLTFEKLDILAWGFSFHIFLSKHGAICDI